ncbi:MAG: hypothetical protein HY842_07955 [Bacteroidetes bacterium]|nr:hypothetical protein [Bacteroidota bacterium]
MNLPIQAKNNKEFLGFKNFQHGILPSQREIGSLAINRCNLRPDPGHCLAYLPRYYYDQAEKRCKQFIYGGCGGTVPFNTLQECEKGCGCERRR